MYVCMSICMNVCIIMYVGYMYLLLLRFPLHWLIDRNSEASISIWLSNKGRLPFKKEQYGHTIHVERRFIKSTAANGKVTCTTNYKLKGVKSRSAIASTKKEVEDMLAQLNIQIDNP